MVLLDDLLYDCEAKSDAFVIDVSRPRQLSESREQFCDVLMSDTFTSIFHLTSKYASSVIIRKLDLNFARVCKLECVLHKVE